MSAVPVLGTYEQVQARYFRSVFLDLFLFVGFFLSAFYHLALYYWRRSELSSLLFGLVCLLLSVSILFSGEGLIHSVPGLKSLHAEITYRILYLAIFPIGALFFHFVLSMFPQPRQRQLLWLAYGISGLFIILTLSTDSSFFTGAFIIYRMLVLIGSLYLLYILFQATRVRRIGARTLLVSLALLFVAMIYDLFPGGAPGADMSRPALFLFAGALALNLAHRFARSFGSLESLSRKLDRRIDVHSDLKTLHGELDAARQFQQSLIPHYPPDLAGLHIAAHYRAMQIVGGDFYDFRSDKNSLGVLMADVSGHGIPAALIVSMLKLAFWQEKVSTPAPGSLFPSMNRLLLGNTGEEFVTAAYVHIDPGAMILSTTNAGHPPVLIWKKQRKELVELRPMGRLLGVFDNPAFEVETVELEIGDRILMYTDGLFETPNGANEQFGVDRFRSFLAHYSHLSVDQFVNRLLNTVVAWAGGEDRIPDDIALIAIDVEALSDADDLGQRVSRMSRKTGSRARTAASRAWKSMREAVKRKPRE
ncbi:MAG: SpoIIE family protein phosphatase, partial [Leptospiraceae bacterium]|nr:SpoIIE family protein phosphatase [Leptospiraceae bacterium]